MPEDKKTDNKESKNEEKEKIIKTAVDSTNPANTVSDKEHVLVKKYLAQHSLVESNITSFNEFIEVRMQEIVNELNENLPQGEGDIKLGKIKVGKPCITEADGSLRSILPVEARLRNLTYSAPIYLEVSIKYNNHIESQEVEIGRIPVIVKSKYCNLAGMTSEELAKSYNDPLDTGGYFIINGNERVMVMIEDLAPNQPFIENLSSGKVALRLFSQRGAYRIPTQVDEASDGTINVSFSRFKNTPAIAMLKALGIIKDAEIAKLIGKETDSLIVNLYEFSNLQSSQDAMMFIAEKTSMQGTKKEVLDRVKQRIDAYLLPHISTKQEDREKKAVTLCKLIKLFLNAKTNPGMLSDKDHYANKRVRLSGDLLADLFRVNLAVLLRDIQHNLQKSIRRKKTYSVKTLAKSTLFSHRIESAIATGNWIGERTGVTQNMDKTNYLAILSQLQRVSSLLPGEQENFLARTLHPTHYGRFCPIETPEGTEIGLRKNLALLARISTVVKLNEKEFFKFLESIGMSSYKKEDDKTIENAVDVIYNGQFIGYVNDANKFVDAIRDERRKARLPFELSVRHDAEGSIIAISTENGRVLRPVIVAKNGVSMLKHEHIELLKKNEIIWNDLLQQGIIEYLDASEEENSLVALTPHDLTTEHTHLEIDEIDMLGLVTSLVPYGNHDQSSRLNRGSKTQKQALGLYAANFLCKLDTDVSILYYPQKPLVRSFVYDTLNIYPAGQNVVVAILTYEGYNLEDAVVINKASVERGLGRSSYFRPYRTTELNYTGGLADEICLPTKDTSGYRTEASYKFLEDDGIVYPEASLNENDVIIGKTSPPKFLSEAGEITVKARKESSVAIRPEEKGTIDAVFLTADDEGNKIIQVRTRDERVPELGDKFSTAHGQKGVIGMLVPEEDMPFTVRGVKPDVLFNPHGIPSRMTVGYLLELLAGKVSSLSGKIIDGTIFSGTNVEELENELEKLGFRYDGKETLFNGITGRMMEAKIFIGNMYYLRLKYMVSNKMHARASGKVTLLTRQPIEGRSRGGALRLGEMEQQALVAHGASLLLKERYDSDKVTVHVCTKCGNMAIKDNIHNKIYCLLCQTSPVEPIQISYAFKLLMDELISLHILPRFELKNKFEA